MYILREKSRIKLHPALLLFQIPFTKDCGSDDVCVSDLVLSVKTDTKASR